MITTTTINVDAFCLKNAGLITLLYSDEYL